MLRIAFNRGASNLKRPCLGFVLANFGKVIALDAFSELPPNVLKEVLRLASRKGAMVRDPIYF